MADIASLEQLRLDAQATFKALGWPGRKQENWHYTDLSRMMPLPVAAPETPGHARDEREDLTDDFAGFDPLRLVFIDGVLVMPSDNEIPDGLDITPLSQTPDAFDKLAANHDYRQDALLAANLGYLTDGVFIRVTGEIKRPLQIIWRGSSPNSAAYGRVRVQMSAGASLTLIENHQGAGVTHLVNEFELADAAQLTHVKIQDAAPEQISLALNLGALAENSHLQSICLGLAGKLGRHENRIMLNGAGAHAETAAVILGTGAQHMDMTTVMEHAVANTTSDTLARSVLGGKSCGVFQGKVIVRPDAQHVEAYQNSNALMLSDNAVMNAKPELEIYADDVECAHGSAIGEIDRDALFFLQSRGIEQSAARGLLIQGFLADVLDRIADADLQDTLKQQINRQLSQFEGLQL